jgi:Ca2+-binding RTX toxin-like protein
MAVINGTSGPDSLAGGAGADQIFGFSDNDTLRGLGGNDTLHGGDGTDYLSGGAGADSLVGGDNGDYAVYSAASGALGVDLGNPANNTGEAAGDSYWSIEKIIGGAFNDTLVGNSEDNGLRGGPGADSLDGGAGLDIASYWDATTGVLADLGNPANNTGEAAGDRYVSIEWLMGGDFDDTLVGDAGENSVNGGMAGNDSLLGLGGNDTLEGADGNDTLSGGTGLDSLVGGAGDDSMMGNRGFDTVCGDAGDDFMQGNRGCDWLIGGEGNDTLEGGAGFDTLFGGAGADLLIGGAGTDVYRYDALSLNTGDVAANTADSITGGQGDLISMLGLNDELHIGGTPLSALTSNTVIGSTLSASTNIAFSGGALQIDLDGDGVFNAAHDFQVGLQDVTAISYNCADGLLHLA